MTKQEFISSMDSFDVDMDYLHDNDEVYMPMFDIKITFNADDTFNIFRDFCYPHKFCEENFENEWRSALEEVTTKKLTEAFGIAPHTDFDGGMGCPFDDSLVGYWGKVYDIEFVKSFVDVCQSAEASNDDIEQRASDFIVESLSEVSEKYMLSQHNKNLFFNEDRVLIVFAHDVSKIEIDNIDTSNLIPVELPVISMRYLCGKKETGEPIAVDIRRIDAFFRLCDHFSVDKSEFDFYCIGNEYLYIKGLIKAIIPLEAHSEDRIDSEYSQMVFRLERLRKIKPRVNTMPLDFSHLTDNEFESLCYDMLIKQGFTNVHPVGDTNAPDGGKDIIAIEEYKTIMGTEHRKWIWQCKHSKKSIGRKDVAEIGDLLQENKASAYGLFCSSMLTPSCIERLELKNSANRKVIYYGKVELVTLLSKYPDLIARYKLAGGCYIE